MFSSPQVQTRVHVLREGARPEQEGPTAQHQRPRCVFRGLHRREPLPLLFSPREERSAELGARVCSSALAPFSFLPHFIVDWSLKIQDGAHIGFLQHHTDEGVTIHGSTAHPSPSAGGWGGSTPLLSPLGFMLQKVWPPGRPPVPGSAQLGHCISYPGCPS